ncbi:hypothetical protein HMPREF1141_1798 [Clostridium sp. MSTE9]|nr:hypothetical protein HMPREF1141_1798 [Clostridium sp. MSTE9]
MRIILDFLPYPLVILTLFSIIKESDHILFPNAGETAFRSVAQKRPEQGGIPY